MTIAGDNVIKRGNKKKEKRLGTGQGSESIKSRLKDKKNTKGRRR